MRKSSPWSSLTLLLSCASISFSSSAAFASWAGLSGSSKCLQVKTQRARLETFWNVALVLGAWGLVNHKLYSSPVIFTCLNHKLYWFPVIFTGPGGLGTGESQALLISCDFHLSESQALLVSCDFHWSWGPGDWWITSFTHLLWFSLVWITSFTGFLWFSLVLGAWGLVNHKLYSSPVIFTCLNHKLHWSQVIFAGLNHKLYWSAVIFTGLKHMLYWFPVIFTGPGD